MAKLIRRKRLLSTQPAERLTGSGERIGAEDTSAVHRDGPARGLASLRPAPSLGLAVQAKLEVGATDDPLEREADVAADQVMRAPADEAAAVQDQDEDGALRRQPAAGASSAGGPAPASVHNALRAPGAPLDPATRSLVEPRMSRDFADVRVHSDSAAAQSAEAIRARAYTSGSHIAFAAGQYAPQTPAGLRLLAHELSHVVQQGAPSPARTQTIRRQSRPAPAQPDPGSAPQSSSEAVQAAIPADWPQRPSITWGSVGLDVHYLRVRLNQVLVGRLAPLPLDAAPSKSLYSKADAAAVQVFQQAMKMVKPGGFIEGGGSAGTASAATIALLRSKAAEPDPEYVALLKIRQPLLDGALSDSGDYDKKKGFTNPTLQRILVYYAKHWGEFDWRTATSDQSEGSAGQTGGDLTPKWVKDFPLWVNVFQDKLVNSPSWTIEEQTVQALLTAFLRAHTKAALGGKLSATVAEFFSHVGKSELNRQSEDLVRGSIGNSVWCAQASSEALVHALQAAGLRPIPSRWQKQPEMLYMGWLTTTIEKKRVAIITPPTSYQTPLEPGDRISVVSKTSPLTGHVATVVQDTGGSIRVVSGNAGGGGGSIRIDEVIRETPPKEYDYDAVSGVVNSLPALRNKEREMASTATWDPAEQTGMPPDWAESPKSVEDWMKVSQQVEELTSKKIPALKAGHNAPKKAGYVWVVRVVRTSELDPTRLAGASNEELAKLGLERVSAAPKAK